MRFDTRHSLLSAVAVMALTGAGAFAQQPAPPVAGAVPPTPPVAGAKATPPAPPSLNAERATPVVTGRVQRWLVNPNGEVDGLLLADGTQVGFPPHLSADVQSALKVGDNVEVSGWRAPNAPVVRAASLKATASGRSVADKPPMDGAMHQARAPRTPRDPGALTAMNASGRVERILYTGRGDANGVLLDSGTIVRFPPRVGDAYEGNLRPGSAIEARGWGTRSPNGSALEATALGSSTETMRDLFAGPGAKPPQPASLDRPGKAQRQPPAPRTSDAAPTPPAGQVPPAPAS
ncbi:hypothetical protein ACSFA3_12940 [Variovorax sp. RHLX14]|uniref:hypothetical protein n=1 Tax=Variovorax sp. RHLX14 TaxID=1259731 RepID=UPI003F47FA2C